MLLLAVLFVSLTALSGYAASSPSPGYVVDVRRPRGLAPRQNIPGVVLDAQNYIPGTGISRLVLASDQRYAPSCPTLAKVPP